ncbi:MAG TPA: hypothetical protein VK066_24955 [Chloroflexota bacterium]|nr:hypothetical protein [Chloroflexota bacterium]
MTQLLIAILILLAIVPLLVFWVSMFSDMTKNDYLTSESKSTWTLMFIVLNVFAGMLYYFTEYRGRR